MAVYIRFNDPNLSPMTCGQAINPATLDWNRINGTLQNCDGNTTKGTNIFAWLYNNDPEFFAFCENNMRNLVRGTYEKYFATYGQDTIKIRFYLEAYASGTFDFGVRVEGNGGLTAYSTRMCWQINAVQANDYTDLLLGEYGPYFIVNPYNQDSVTGWGVVYKACPPYSNRFYTNDSFISFYDYNNATNRATILNIIFGKSKQDTGPDSDEGGGWGDFNDGTDTITLPGVPGISALSAGFVNMYNPSPAQLQVLVSALWSNDISQVFWKMFTDPMESLVSLQIFPVAPEVTPASVNIVMGNVTLQDQSTTPITFALAPALTNQYKIIDCGSLQMNEYWGSALDYSPYTKAEIFLPYIGVKEIDINDVMAATLHLQYIVDFLTGTCTAQLECVKAQHIDFSAPLYHWQGNMAMAVPASASDMSQLITSIASTLVSAGLTVATGGSGAAIASGIAGGALNMANAHPRIEKGGTVAMTAGALDNQTPFIILTRPIQSKPAGFENYKGWPSNITAEIGSLSGYTEVEYVHVEVAGATDEERNEIERLLKEGVII